jgi:hypothetical protein
MLKSFNDLLFLFAKLTIFNDLVNHIKHLVQFLTPKLSILVFKEMNHLIF